MPKKEKQVITGMWIPGEVVFNFELTMNDCLIWWVISSFEKCFANNEYFSDLFGISKVTVSRAITKLKKLGYIKDVGKQRRVLALDETYIKSYRHLVFEYNELVSGKKKIKKKEKKYKKAKRDRFAQKVLEHWNSKGSPFVKHHPRGTGRAEEIFNAIEKALEKNSHRVIIKAIDECHSLFTIPGTKINLRKPGYKKIGLNKFFRFDPYLKKNIDKYTKEIDFDSWFEECKKGEKHLLEKFSKIIKDEYPKVTKQFKAKWGKEISIKDENSFRRASKKLVMFLEENKKKLKFSLAELTYPSQCVKYVYRSLRGRTRLVPSTFSRDWVYEEHLPEYLKENGYM